MNTIFVSYSHRGRGQEWHGRIIAALDCFHRHGLLDVWSDQRLETSAPFEREIRAAMSKARLAVVLLTNEALGSDFITRKELPFLRERHESDGLIVWPVVCERCDWRTQLPWMAALHLGPGGTKPLAEMTEAEASRVLRQSATEIAELLSRAALSSILARTEPMVPARVYLDNFPLTPGPSLHRERLVGREQELALLDLSFAQPDVAVASLVAWGGVGKSMLVREWLRRLENGSLNRDDARRPWFGAQRVYAWNFYSQGTREDRQASEDSFLAHALSWFGVQCEPTLSPWDKGRLLAEAIAGEPTLLVLDGIEPLQYPPGPMGGRLRAPGLQSLLKRLARKVPVPKPRPSALDQSLCLITTREPLADLVDFEQGPDPARVSVLRVDLGNLTDEAGAALLHHAGARRAGAAEIEAGDRELVAASREVSGHALTLNLLGRFLARAHGGDIRRRDLVKFEEADRREQGGTTFKMLSAFEAWFARGGEFGARQLAVLRMLGLFDRPADAGCLAALRSPPVIPGLTDPLFTTNLAATAGQPTVEPIVAEDWNTATSFLADFGLILIQGQADNHEQTLDCHPLVREHFARRLNHDVSESWHAAHRRLYVYLRDTTPDRPQPTLGELQPLYQAVSHGCLAQHYSEALELIYWRRIQRREEWYAWKKLGAISSEIQLFAAYFGNNWSQIPQDLRLPDATFILNQAGLMLESQGRLAEAIELVSAGFRLHSTHGILRQAAAGGSNLSELHLLLGAIDEARRSGVEAVKIADRSGDPFQVVHDRTTLAVTLFSAGQISEATDMFSEAETFQQMFQPQLPRLYALRGYRRSDCLLFGAERGAWANQLSLDHLSIASGWYISICREIEERVAYSSRLVMSQHWLLDTALDKLTLGRILLYQALLDHELGDKRSAVFAAAKLNLSDAVDGFRNAGEIEYLPSGLLSDAWGHFLESDVAGAQANLDEAWDIAERGPMRLHLADIHLHRARLFFREKTYPWKSPEADLAAAEKLINECGYHRRDEELADAKRAILGL